MNTLRSIIYIKWINYLIRNLLRPIRTILPKSFLIPVNGIVKIKLDKDKSIFIDGNQTCFVTRLLFWQGIYGYDYDTVKIFTKLISNSRCFFDIGANVGYYSFLAFKYNPSIKIYSFEPSPGTYNYLIHNISLNKATHNIFPEKIALSDHEGEVTFFQHYNSKVSDINQQLGGGSSLSVEETSKHEFVEIKVTATTIDSFILKNKIENLDFIKLDTEATEHLILKGGLQSLHRFKPLIICEVLKNKIESELETIFNELGYKYYRVSSDGLHSMAKLYFETYKEDIYFVHPKKEHLIKEFISGRA